MLDGRADDMAHETVFSGNRTTTVTSTAR